MGGILLLAAEQTKQASAFANFANVEILVQPVKFKDLVIKIRDVLAKI